ncbi:MAG: DUF4271 domain-containing protein [Bacteroidales bacterium]|nr:DUF4271 domain-containing protein [Bacteroidales bacterium]
MKNIVLIFVFFILPTKFFSQNNIDCSLNTFGAINYVDNQIELENLTYQNLPEPSFEFSSSWWQSVLFLSYLTILSFFYTKFNSEISTIFKAFFKKNIFNQLNVSQNTIFYNILVVFNFLFFILISTFFYRILRIQSPYNTYSSLLLYISIFSVLFLFYHIKLFSAFFWGFLFEKKDFFKDFYVNLRIANLIQSVMLLFVLFITTYNVSLKANLIDLAFFVIISSFLIRVFNVLQQFFSKGFLLFYLILYLCTVEILPVLLAYKYLLSGLQ